MRAPDPLLSICGTCERAHEGGPPAACDGCGAPADAPWLLVYTVHGSDGGALRIDFREEWRGPWDPEVRAAWMRSAIRLVE